jgi:hypothetical protein
MTNIYEGFIVQETTPQAFALVESWNSRVADLKNLPEVDLAEAVNELKDHHLEMIRALGRIEQALNTNAGKVITA